LIAFYAGKSATISIAASTKKLRNWTFKMHGDAVDTTNFNSTNGKRENVAGLANGVVTAEGPYDQGSLALTVGNTYEFILNAGSSSFTVTARITDLTPSVAVDGVAVVNIEAVSTGDFTAATT
jgi:hypothetical protein